MNMQVMDFLSVAPLSWRSIGAAILCGAIVGYERQVRGKPIGIRTSALIVLGTYLFIAISTLVVNEAGDPSRVVGQVVSGIGFLGAGVMLSREGVVVGVTSAATIWVLAAIGVCIPVVGEGVAIKLAILVVLILYLLDLFDDHSMVTWKRVYGRVKGRDNV